MVFTGATVGRTPFVFNGSGSPSGSITPTGYGDIYIDTSGGASYLATGLTNTDWTLSGGVSSSAFSTYNPTFGFGTTEATTWTYGTQTGRYKQVGNIYFYMVDVTGTLTTKGSASGYFYISLPATARNSLQGYFSAMNRNANFTFPTSTTDLLSGPVGNTARLSFAASKSAGTLENVDDGDFTEGLQYRFHAAGWFEAA